MELKPNKSAAKPLCILILQYNSADLTIQLLESIVRYENKNLGRYRIIVMDNASEEPRQQKITQQFPFIEFVQYEENLGFARAHNRIMSQVHEKWVLLLNNDCILMNDAITKTLIAAKEKHADFATCSLFNKDGSKQVNFSVTPTPFRRIFLNISGINRLFLEKVRLKLNSSRIGYLNGAYLMIKRESIPGGKLFDDRYFMYTEDLDLTLRLYKTKNRGYRFSEGKVCHLAGASASRQWRKKETDRAKMEQAIECMEQHFPRWKVRLWLGFRRGVGMFLKRISGSASYYPFLSDKK